MRIGSVVGAVLPDNLYVILELEVSVTDQVHLVIHGEMSVCVVIVRKRDLPVAAGGKLIAADHGGSVFIAAVVDDDRSVIAPHLVADPVSAFSCIAPGISQRIVSFRSHPPDLVLPVIIDPDPADTAVKRWPFMVVHDDLRIGGIELHMGDPALRYRFFIEQLSALRVIHAEPAVQAFLLDAAVDVIDRPPVQATALRFRVIIQGPGGGHGDAQVFPVLRDMGERGHAVRRHLGKHALISVQSDAADEIVTDVICRSAVGVQADARFAQTFAGIAVKIDIAFHDPVPVVREDPFLSGQEIPGHHIGRAAHVRDQEKIPVVTCERGAGEIKQLGVVSVFFALTAAEEYTFPNVFLHFVSPLQARCHGNLQDDLPVFRRTARVTLPRDMNIPREVNRIGTRLHDDTALQLCGFRTVLVEQDIARGIQLIFLNRFFSAVRKEGGNLGAAGDEQLQVDILAVDFRIAGRPRFGLQVHHLQDHGHTADLCRESTCLMMSQVHILQAVQRFFQRLRKHSSLLFKKFVINISVDHRFILIFLSLFLRRAVFHGVDHVHQEFVGGDVDAAFLRGADNRTADGIHLSLPALGQVGADGSDAVRHPLGSFFDLLKQVFFPR